MVLCFEHYLQVDVSGVGLGTVVSIVSGERESPINFISHRLTDAEGKYHANELECLVGSRMGTRQTQPLLVWPQACRVYQQQRAPLAHLEALGAGKVCPILAPTKVYL